MPNHYHHSKNSHGKVKYANPEPAAAPKFPEKNVSWPAMPKGRGPERNPWKTARKAKIHPVSEGL